MPAGKTKKPGNRKEVIAAAAATLFREKGFSATGMRDIAEAVGIEAASLYNHIHSKAELLREICFRMANTFHAHLQSVEASEKISSLEKLESIVRFQVRMWIDQPDEMLVATNEFRSLDEPYLETFLNERKIYVRRIEAIISQGIREGIFRKTDPYSVVLTLMSAVRGIEYWHRSRKNVSAKSLEEAMVSIIVQGVRK